MARHVTVIDATFFIQDDRVFVKILPRNVDVSKLIERELRMVNTGYSAALTPLK